jgi:methylenetetrahydrofolate reductase (NADPH)
MSQPGQPITALFQAGRPLVSVEFFPPKSPEGERQLLDTATALAPFRPDFVSITYGAGGSTRQRTLEYGLILRERFGFEVMPHLTCVGHSRAELHAVLRQLRDAGFRNLMTLRGDPPKGATTFQPHPDGLRYASELVAFIREHYPEFCLGVGGYPETHPEASSPEDDLRHLKHKIDAGADFITTQLFFDNAAYFAFVARCRAAGITVPIVPGILPPLSHPQVKKFTAFCGAKYPAALETQLAPLDKPELAAAAETAGIAWTDSQIQGLVAARVPGLHLYLLNRASSALALFTRLQQDGLLPSQPPAG